MKKPTRQIYRTAAYIKAYCIILWPWWYACMVSDCTVNENDL